MHRCHQTVTANFAGATVLTVAVIASPALAQQPATLPPPSTSAPPSAKPTPANNGPSPIAAQLKSQFDSWLASVVGPNADGDMVRDMSARLGGALAGTENIQVTLDGEMTVDGKGRCALTWGGRLHVFEINQAQCRARGAKSRGAIAGLSDRKEAAVPLTPAPFILESMHVQNSDGITGDGPIAGTVTCRANPQAKPLATGTRLVLRTMIRTARSSRLGLRFLDAIPEDGVLTFSIDKINSDGVEWQFGPTPIVIDLLATSADAGEGLVASNAVGMIVDVLPDHEGYLNAGLVFMEDVAAILATVQDEASATKAIEEFQKIALRNKALNDAMQRLPPLPPDKDAELTAKLEPRLNAVAAKLQEQMDRLEQAPYAGQAFFDRLDESVNDE